MNKAIFFDLDGTLIDPQSNSIPASAIEALKKLKTNGHFLAIATGRSIRSVIESNIHDVIKWDGYVCSSGQQVFLPDFTLLYGEYMDKEILTKIQDICLKNDINAQFQCEDSFMLKEPDSAVFESHGFFNEPIPQKIKRYDDENIEMVMVYHHDHRKFDLFKDINDIVIYPGQAPYADVISSNNSKYHGIKAMLDHIGYDTYRYIAFGDSFNDYEMIKNATYSIAMGNAHPSIKNTADMITRSVDQDGVYAACHRMGLL